MQNEGIYSLVIGSGISSSTKLYSDTDYSLAIGFKSTVPTFFVSQSQSSTKTGRIGIGNITDPSYKLHIKADDNEDATIFLQPTGSNYYGKIFFGDESHSISAKTGEALTFFTETGQNFAFEAGNILQTTGFNLTTSQIKAPDATGLSLTDMNGNGIFVDNGGNVGIGTENPSEKFQIGDRWVFHNGGTKYIGYNCHYFNGSSERIIPNVGASQIRFGETGNIIIRTAPPETGNNITWSENISILNNGNMGIGVDSPNEKLEVVQTIGDKYALRLFHTNDNGGNGLLIESNGGSNDDVLLKIIGDKNGGNPRDILYVEGTGKIGIGTTEVQSGYKLTVDGNIMAEEVKIQNSDTWYDYVLEESYDLPKLSELDSYIKQNKHLPDVPSAQQVAENGYELGEMNGILLKKVEELTLYVIEQQKEIEKLKEIMKNRQ